MWGGYAEACHQLDVLLCCQADKQKNAIQIQATKMIVDAFRCWLQVWQTLRKRPWQMGLPPTLQGCTPLRLRAEPSSHRLPRCLRARPR